MATQAKPHPTCGQTPRQRMENVANGLERMAEQLEANERPGHVEYLSKSGAAYRAAAFCLDLRQIVADVQNGEEFDRRPRPAQTQNWRIER